MKNVKKCISLLVAMACVLSLLTIGAVAAEPAVVFAEDFSEGAGGFGGNVTVADGEATLSSNQFFMVDVPAEKLLASNNYEISFDMKWNAGTVLYFHLVGLNGNDNTNLYLRVEANGQYWSIHDFSGHSIYNNSGSHTGALDYNGVDLSTYANVKVVHYNGYIELWVNGTRRFVSHLSNFGNNQYSTRTAINEGTITGFAFHAENANAVVIDNFTVKEAVGNNATYSQGNTAGEGYSILPLSAVDLDRESFYVETTYQINNDDASGYYPTIALYGMNASLVNQNGKEYSVNCQCYMDKLYVTPQIFAQTESVDWVGASDAPAFQREAGQTLVELGFDIVNIANNHMLDKWESGLLATIDYWETKDVLLLGAYRDQADYDSIRVYTCPDGTKIAFLSYTYGTNGMKLTSGSKHIIPWIDPDDITRQVRLAKEVGDLVFVSIHWGTESSFEETGEQHTLAQLMADNGVDVVIGHHPHVLQSVEWIDGKNGNKTLVAYSIGNMLSTMLTSNYMVGAFMTFDIRITPAGERSIENPVMIPIMCHYNDKRAGLQVYKLEDYTEDLANAHGAQLNKKFNMAALYGYVTDNIADEFLPKSFLDKAK